MRNHPHYEPSNAFIERHGLTIEETEVWVYLPRADGFRLDYNKETGCIVLRDESGEVSFCGFVPTEEALEQVIAYTNW